MGNHFKNHLIPEGCEVHAVIDRNGFRLFARIEGMDSELPIECKDRLFMDCVRNSFKYFSTFSQEYRLKGILTLHKKRRAEPNGTISRPD